MLCYRNWQIAPAAPFFPIGQLGQQLLDLIDMPQSDLAMHIEKKIIDLELLLKGGQSFDLLMFSLWQKLGKTPRFAKAAR